MVNREKVAKMFNQDGMLALVTQTVDIQEVLDDVSEKLKEVDVKTLDTLKGDKGDSIKGDKGDSIKGDKGDAPTKKELIALIRPLIPQTIKGDKGLDAMIDYDRIIKEVLSGVTLPEADKVDMLDELVKQVPVIGGDIASALELLPEGERLQTKAIEDSVTGKGLDVLLKELENTKKVFIGSGGGSSGASNFLSLSDTFTSFATRGLEVVRVNGAEDALETVALAGGGDALTADPLSQFASTTKAQLNGVISDGTPMYVGDAPTVHTHTKVDITDFVESDYATGAEGDLAVTAEQVANKDAVSGYAGLDGSGKINPLQLPALAISTTSVVATELAQLALTVQEGDVAVRSDLNKSYIALNSTNAAMTDWQELLTPTDAVQSVFGRSGTVTAQNGDYTAAQVGADPAGTDNSTDVTLAGTPNYLTIVGQIITRALIDLANHVTGLLPDGNIASASTWNGKIANVLEDTTPQAGGNFDLNKNLLGDASFYANGNSGTALTINTNNGKYQTVTLTGSVTLTFTAPTTLNATTVLVIYTWDATGGWDITHPASVIEMGAFPTFTGATAGQRVEITYLWDGTNYHAMSSEIY